jgi:hypothetical protein
MLSDAKEVERSKSDAWPIHQQQMIQTSQIVGAAGPIRRAPLAHRLPEMAPAGA